MPTHWTYDAVSAEADLGQGDVIEPTLEVRGVLKQVHPHFLDAKYVSFMLLSQSCDLVRRPTSKGQPITLCVVRELRSVSKDLLQLFCGSGVNGVFREDRKVTAKQFLERVINQNEQAIGLFYLHPDADSGISTESIAMLRIAISLRTDHYDLLKRARRGRLKSEFQAKLGWLVGNLYSRVGTEDWSEPRQRKLESEKIIKNVVESLNDVAWASEQAIRKASEVGYETTGKSPAQISKELAELEPASLDQLMQQALRRILADQRFGLNGTVQEQIMARIPNDAEMSSLLKRMRLK